MFLEFFLNLVISTLLSELLTPKQHFSTPAAATLTDFTFPTASEDRPIPVLWGTRKQTSTNSLWQGDFSARPITQKVRTSLFSSQTVTTGYDYFVGMQLGLCIADIDSVESIWCQDVCVFKATAGQQTVNKPLPILGTWQDGGTDSGTSGVMVIHSGDSTPDAYMATQVTLNPAFPHMSYAVFVGPSQPGVTQFPGLLAPQGGKGSGWVGSSSAIRAFDFVLKRLPKVVQYGIPQALSDQYSAVSANDANISFCLLELLCNVDWGAGVPPALVDLDSFLSAAATLSVEGNGCSLLWDTESACSDIASELMKQANGCLYTDLTTGLIKFHLVRVTDAPKMVLDDDNIIEMTSFVRAGTDESSNCIKISFNDTGNGFIDRVARAQDLGAIEMSGQTIATTVQYPGISDSNLASTLSMRDLRAATASLSKFQLKAVLPVGTVLHPGDLLTLSFSLHGITNMGVRVVSAAYSDASKGEVDLTLVQDIFLPGTTVYAVSLPPLQTGTGLQPPGFPAWQNANFIAPYPFNPTPQAPVGLYFCGAPAVNPQQAFGYRLGFFDANTVRDLDTVQWADGNTQFAAKVQTTGALPVVAGATVGYTATPSDAYTIAQNSGATALVLTSYGELITARASNGQLTVAERGAYGTLPSPMVAGQTLYILYGFVVDPKPLVVGVSDYGTGYAKILQSSFVRPQTFGPGGKGPFDEIDPSGDAGNVTSWGADPSVAAAATPYAPGNVAIGGNLLVPITNSYDPSFVAQMPSSLLTTVTFTGRNRLITSAAQGYQTGLGLEPGSTVTATVAYCPVANYAPGSGSLKSLPTTYTATSGSFAITDAIPAGALVMQCTLRVVSPSGGTGFYTFAWQRPAS
ncbi:Putative phage tail protein [Burkholderia sp. YR290]|nr:Putative phage tail protein [Burkholderia sp. YR290]